MLHQMKPFSDKGSIPSPLERACPDASGGWVEVRSSRLDKGFNHFVGQQLLNIKIMEKLFAHTYHIGGMSCGGCASTV